MTPESISRLPSYKELLERRDAPPGSSWGLFGPDDQLGTLNFLSKEATANAATNVREGLAYSLDLTSDAITPSLAPTRKPMTHNIFQRNPFHHDEWLDNVYTQYGSQIDGLRHIGHPDYGFYNGNDPKKFRPGTHSLSIHHFTAAPIVGRGVLVDVAHLLEQEGRPIDYTQGQAIPIETVQRALDVQRVTLQPGDIVLIRFGWLTYYREVATEEIRSQLAANLLHPGLLQSHETVAWLWDNRISLIAADNFALECWPARPESPFYTREEMSSGAQGPHSGIMHRAILPLLGMPIGELWNLDDLAHACHEDKRYDFLLTSSPLPIVGGVGSPANAIAIR